MPLSPSGFARTSALRQHPRWPCGQASRGAPCFLTSQQGHALREQGRVEIGERPPCTSTIASSMPRAAAPRVIIPSDLFRGPALLCSSNPQPIPALNNKTITFKEVKCDALAFFSLAAMSAKDAMRAQMDALMGSFRYVLSITGCIYMRCRSSSDFGSAQG